MYMKTLAARQRCKEKLADLRKLFKLSFRVFSNLIFFV
ncbi:hypothetical protein MY9_3285 [Bacillus sp. JS]|nr:hypothetical protein MY9_3285 [Bacillus sp. JS]